MFVYLQKNVIIKAIVYKIVLQLIVIVLVVIGVGAKAQYPYNFSFAGIPLDSKTIVRNYDDQRAVVYYEEGGRGYVSLVDVVVNHAITVPLDNDISMNDMCIVDDSVFLCGQELASNGSLGCIATMNLNNFYTGSVLVSYFEHHIGWR